jgi:hypothetical protein
LAARLADFAKQTNPLDHEPERGGEQKPGRYLPRGQRFVKPMPAVQQDQHREDLEREEAIETVRARSAQRPPRKGDNAGGSGDEDRY